MAISIVVSNDMWNEKDSAAQVSAYDDLNVYVHFDQAISHELGYIENEVTHFMLQVSSGGEVLAELKTNRVLPELMSEAKNFKNGKFKFPLSAMPNALSQSYHALFAQKMAQKPAATYRIELSFSTDNPIQAGQSLAQAQFDFELTEDAKSYLGQIAEANIAQGADVEEDPEAKQAAFARINTPSEKFEQVMLSLVNRASGDVWVMLGYNSGQLHKVPYQQTLTLCVPAGENVYKYENQACGTNFGQVSPRHAEQRMEVY